MSWWGLFMFVFLNFFLKLNSMVSILLVFEMISVMFMMVFWVKTFSMVVILFFLFITIMEAILGLSLLLFLLRQTSSDLMKF